MIGTFPVCDFSMGADDDGGLIMAGTFEGRFIAGVIVSGASGDAESGSKQRKEQDKIKQFHGKTPKRRRQPHG